MLVSDVVKELFLDLGGRSLVGYWSFLNRSSVGSLKRSQKYPIVLIHGWLDNNSALTPFEQYLKSRGFQVYLPQIGLGLQDINKLTIIVKKLIEDKELKEVVLVGLCLGGIVGLNYAQDPKNQKLIRKIITVATPFYGAPLGKFVPFSLSARQLRTKSDFLEKLRQKNFFPRSKIICLRAKGDQLVPGGSSHFKGARVKTVDCYGHVNLQSNLKTFQLVARLAKN